MAMLIGSAECHIDVIWIAFVILEPLAKDVLNVPVLTLVKNLKLAPSTVQRRHKGKKRRTAVCRQQSRTASRAY